MAELFLEERFVEEEIAILKKTPVTATDEDLFTSVREIAAWKVWVAVFRKPLATGIFLGFCAVGLNIAWSWSDPLFYTLTIRGADRAVHASDPLALFHGMNVGVEKGRTMEMQFLSANGFVKLEGGSSLVVRGAGVRKISGLHWFVFDLPQGSGFIRFGDRVPHDFQISTPEAFIRLTGTLVYIQSLNGVTQVKVFNGSAEIRNILTREHVVLSAGKMAKIGSETILVHEIPDEEGTENPVSGAAEMPSGQEDGGNGRKTTDSSLWYEVKP